MHRIDDLHISAFAKFQQGAADIFHRLAKVLAAVGSDEDEFANCHFEDCYYLEQSPASSQIFWLGLFRHELQRIDDRIACHFDDALVYTFIEQVVLRPLCGCKMQISDHACHTAIDLLGEGLPFVVGAQDLLPRARI
jgi:hypothetical protein